MKQNERFELCFKVCSGRDEITRIEGDRRVQPLHSDNLEPRLANRSRKGMFD